MPARCIRQWPPPDEAADATQAKDEVRDNHESVQIEETTAVMDCTQPLLQFRNVHSDPDISTHLNDASHCNNSEPGILTGTGHSAPFGGGHELSRENRIFLGQQVPTNTSRNNMVSLRAFCKFILTSMYQEYISSSSNEHILYKARFCIFPDGSSLPSRRC